MEMYGKELNIHLTIRLIINSQIMFRVESIARDQAIGTLQQKNREDFLIKVTFPWFWKWLGGCVLAVWRWRLIWILNFLILVPWFLIYSGYTWLFKLYYPKDLVDYTWSQYAPLDQQVNTIIKELPWFVPNRKRLQIAAFFYDNKCVAWGLFTLPAQRTASLIICHTRFEEVLLFTQVHHFRHPLERVVHTSKLLRQAQLC